jgi:hypothetical protein
VYQVSSDGAVRSLDRVVEHMRHGRLVPCRYVGVTLTQTAHPDGHMRVWFTGDDGRTTKYVHHLVLEAFVGPRPPGRLGLHNDGAPSHNWVSNLRWGTHGDNSRDAVRHGHMHKTRRTTCPRGHALRAPNLEARDSARGHRSCLVCPQARKWAKRHGHTGSAWVEDAHRRYRVLVGDPGWVPPDVISQPERLTRHRVRR